MNIDALTLGEIKSLRGLFGAESPVNNGPWIIGKTYFIRTVTMHLIGKLESVGTQELEISSASWIADSGRFHEAIKTGNLNEVEPFTDNVIVGRGSIVDATEWKHASPRSAK